MLKVVMVTLETNSYHNVPVCKSRRLVLNSDTESSDDEASANAKPCDNLPSVPQFMLPKSCYKPCSQPTAPLNSKCLLSTISPNLHPSPSSQFNYQLLSNSTSTVLPNLKTRKQQFVTSGSQNQNVSVEEKENSPPLFPTCFNDRQTLEAIRLTLQQHTLLLQKIANHVGLTDRDEMSCGSYFKDLPIKSTSKLEEFFSFVANNNNRRQLVSKFFVTHITLFK